MTRTSRTSAAVVALLLLASSCGSDGETSIATDDADTTASTQSDASADASDDNATASADGLTAQGVEVAQWGENVELTVSDGSFRFVSNGLPNHELPDQFLVPNLDTMPPFTGDDIAGSFNIADTAELMVESPLDVEITLNPVYSEEITQTSLSTIGVMISGAPLFNDYEDQGREYVALDDNLSLDGVFFIDACNGHPLATGDSYHYHGVPYCITDDVDVDGEHSTIIGVLLDGFPIYGPNGADGVNLANSDLDECSGHVEATPEFPEGIYHYHLTEDANPYSIDCFHGEIDYGGDAQGGPPPGGGGEEGGDENAGGPPAGGGPDFSEAAVALGIPLADLEAALGQPPFDLEAAAATLGVTADELGAVLPEPPQGGGGGGGGGGGAPPPGDG